MTLGGLDLGKIEASDQTLEVVETIIHEQYKETYEAVYNDIGDKCLLPVIFFQQTHRFGLSHIL